MTLDFYIVELMNNRSDVDVATDDSSSVIRGLTSIHLIVDVRTEELRRKGRELERSIALKLPEILIKKFSMSESSHFAQ